MSSDSDNKSDPPSDNSIVKADPPVSKKQDFDDLIKWASCDADLLPDPTEVKAVNKYIQEDGVRSAVFTAVSRVEQFRRLKELTQKVTNVDDILIAKAESMTPKDLMYLRDRLVQDQTRIVDRFLGNEEAGTRPASTPAIAVQINNAPQAAGLSPADVPSPTDQSRPLTPISRQKIVQLAARFLKQAESDEKVDEIIDMTNLPRRNGNGKH
jgi:hypothetical protein